MNDNLIKLESLEKQVGNLSKLVEINGIINSTLNINRLLSIIMEMIKDIMETEASSLLLYDEKDNELVFKVALGEAGEELREKYRVNIGQGIAGWVARERKSLRVNDVYSDDRFESMYDKNTGFVTKSILCSPLLFKGKLLGVIQAINPLRSEGFDDDDVNLFRVFSNQAALAVQNAIFFQRAIEEERIQSELEAATTIQLSLAPDLNYDDAMFSCAAKTVSAREVGGGFHFFRELGSGMYLIALGSLNQKGIPGALRASTITGAIKALADTNDNTGPEFLISILHRICLEEGNSSELSIFMGLVDSNNCRIDFVNAGDAYPVLVRGHEARYLRFTGRTSGHPGNPDFHAGNISIPLCGGDSFTVFSKTLPDVKNRNGKKMGLPRIMRYLEDAGGSSAAVIDSLMSYRDKFTGGLDSTGDVSVMSFKVKQESI